MTFFNIQSESKSYSLFSCSGQSTCSGKRVNGLVVEALDESCQFNLPTVIECDEISENRGEIPTPEVTDKYLHLQDIAVQLMPLDSEINILLLIGRDLGDAHHVLEQRIGPPNAPNAQELHLGWVIVGEVVLKELTGSGIVVANKVMEELPYLPLVQTISLSRRTKLNRYSVMQSLSIHIKMSQSD